MKSAGNEGVVQSRLQVLHVHVFFTAPLCARHMAEPGTDQHQGGVAVDVYKRQDNDDPEELIILNRTAKKMTPEKQKKLLEIAKIMFAEDFKKNE